MIRAALRDLFPSRSTVGALRSRIAELEHENKSLGEAYARANAYNRNLHAECERLEREIANPAPYVPEEAGPCPDRRCTGKLRFVRVGECACNLYAPCQSCLTPMLACDECGWRNE